MHRRLEELSQNSNNDGLLTLARKRWYKLGAMTTDEQPHKRDEISAFIVLAVVLAPALAIAGIGGYGLLIWILQ